MDILEYIQVYEINEIKSPTGQIYTLNTFLGSTVNGVLIEVSSNRHRYVAKMTTIIEDYEKEVEVYNIVSSAESCDPYSLFDNFILDFDRPVGILILEFMKNNLETQDLQDNEVSQFIMDTLYALMTLHENHIAHGNISAGNIFRSFESTFKLGDFSESIIDATPRQMLTDSYSIGSVFLETIYGIDPIKAYKQETWIYPRKEDSIPSDAIETMIRGLINLDSRQRWTVKQAFDYIMNI
jgi:serine/threonine protein kinase